MSLSRAPITILWFAFAAALGACGRGRTVAIQDLPRDLIVPAPASGARATAVYGHVEVHYQLDEPFPATQLLERLDRELAGQGWERRLDDVLMPNSVSGQVDGWNGSLATRGGRGVPTEVWDGAWSNSAGELVWYTLTYESTPIDASATSYVVSPDNSRLEVVGVHYPADAARIVVEMGRQNAARNPAVPPHDVAAADARVLARILVEVNMAGAGPAQATLAATTRPVCATGAGQGACFAPDTVRREPAMLTRSLVTRNARSAKVPHLEPGPGAPLPVVAAAASSAPQLACSLPGYAMGEALIDCALVVAGKARADEVYHLRHAQRGDVEGWEVIR